MRMARKRLGQNLHKDVDRRCRAPFPGMYDRVTARSSSSVESDEIQRDAMARRDALDFFLVALDGAHAGAPLPAANVPWSSQFDRVVDHQRASGERSGYDGA